MQNIFEQKSRNNKFYYPGISVMRRKNNGHEMQLFLVHAVPSVSGKTKLDTFSGVSRDVQFENCNNQK
jgi:hypothetical protein